jgi:cobalt-zinc-cadmium efflux system protein
MSSHHHHNHHHHEHAAVDNMTGKKLFLTIILNFIITAAQIVGGILSNSLALFSDALHNLSDGVAVLLAWIAYRLGKKPGTPRQTFGFRRSEILAAFINSVALIAISVYLIVEAAQRFTDTTPVDGGIMLWMGIIGLVANVFSVLLLQKDKGSNINVRAAYLHLLGDALTSMAVIIGAIVIELWQIYWIDPLVTVIISVYILYHTIGLLKESTSVLMQFTPSEVDLVEAKKKLETLPEINNVHHLHSWALSEESLYFEAHVNLQNDLPTSKTLDVRHDIEELLHHEYGIEHVTLQFEYNSHHHPGILVDGNGCC